jgi:hypothetical protein
MSKARDLASAAPAFSTVSATELGYLDGVTSAIQTQVDAKIAKTLTTTTGDIIYASGANTPARLGIGSSAQVLTVAAGIPSWATASSPADSWTLLNAGGTSLSGTAVNITGISGQNELMVLVYNCSVATGSQYPINITFNADGANHNYFMGYQEAPSTYSTNKRGQRAYRYNWWKCFRSSERHRSYYGRKFNWSQTIYSCWWFNFWWQQRSKEQFWWGCLQWNFYHFKRKNFYG